MELTNTRKILDVRDADLSDSRFSEVKADERPVRGRELARVYVHKVNLAGAQFDDVTYRARRSIM